MKPTTALALTALTTSASFAAAEPASCITQPYASLAAYPQAEPTDEAIYWALIDYGSDQRASCIKASRGLVPECRLENPSLICGFSTAGPSTAQSAWTSLISEAAGWWSSNGEQIRSLRAECPDSWKKEALFFLPYAEEPMKAALAFAQCWAEAQGETLSPTPELGGGGAAATGGSVAAPGSGTAATGSTPVETGSAAPTASDKDGAAAGLRAWGCGAVGLVAAAVVLVL